MSENDNESENNLSAYISVLPWHSRFRIGKASAPVVDLTEENISTVHRIRRIGVPADSYFTKPPKPSQGNEFFQLVL